MQHVSGVVRWQRSMRYLIFGLALVLSAAVIAARATPSWALDKNDPGPTVLCTDPDGCSQGPDDPNIYTWDGAISGSPSGSDLHGAGFTCGWGSSPGAPVTLLNTTDYGCWRGSRVYKCTYHNWILFGWASDCVLARP